MVADNLGGATPPGPGISMAVGTCNSVELGEILLPRAAPAHPGDRKIVVRSAECCEEQRLCSVHRRPVSPFDLLTASASIFSVLG